MPQRLNAKPVAKLAMRRSVAIKIIPITQTPTQMMMAMMRAMTLQLVIQTMQTRIPAVRTVIAMIVVAIVKAVTVIVKDGIVPNVVAAKSARS
jgi:hypothetical protein